MRQSLFVANWTVAIARLFTIARIILCKYAKMKCAWTPTRVYCVFGAQSAGLLAVASLAIKLQEALMPIQYESRTVYLGRSGIVTTIIDLVSRAEFARGTAGIAAGDRATSVGEFLAKGDWQGLRWIDSYTGEEHYLTREAVLQAFPDYDFDNSFMAISTSFWPDPGQLLYPSDMVDQLRERGMPEEEIQKMLELEKTARKR